MTTTPAIDEGKAQDQATANEIYRQLGGSRFVMFTGARNFVWSRKEGEPLTLTFKIPGSPKKINLVKVELDEGNDLYNMRFCRFSPSKLETVIVTEHEGIYCDMLQDLFLKETGLHTRF